MAAPSLEGITVVSFESRMADTTARLIEKYGGTAISAPSLQEVPLDEHEAAFDFAERLFDDAIDVVLFTTGVGTRMLFETLATRYTTDDVIAALEEVIVVARGPKPVRTLKKYGIPITLKVPEPNTWKEVLDVLTTCPETTPLDGKRVAIQEYGRPTPALNAALRAQGARLVRVPIYRWTLPDDLQPLKNGLRVLIGGTAQIAVFTSRQQVEHVLQVAANEGWEQSLRNALDHAIVASIGPVCSEGLDAHDIAVDFEPERPKLGILIKGLAETIDSPQQTEDLLS